MRGKILAAGTVLCALSLAAGVQGAELKCCKAAGAVPDCLKSCIDMHKAQTGRFLRVREGLLDQDDTNTLSLSAPEGMETVTVWQAADEGDHYCNGVCVVKFKDRLFCQWQSSQTDEDAPDTHICYAVSEDGGKTWGEARRLPADIDGGYCSSGGWLNTGDTLVAYINFWPSDISPRGGYTYCVTTEDGENWSEVQQVKMADDTPLDAIFEQDPHILANGRIVNAAHFQAGLTVSPIYTDDKTGIGGWHRAQIAATDKGDTSREMEPSIFEQDDGTLTMIFRDQDSSFTKRAAVSKDNGETWSEIFATAVPDARTKQSGGNLSDGTAFMVGSPVNNKLRSPLAILLSQNGRYFDRAYLLRSGDSDPEVVYEGKAKRKGFHYAKSYVCDGRVYVGYATNKEAVEITVIPEDSLKSTDK